MSKPVYQPQKVHSIMLKLSGEVLAGSKGFGFDDAVVDQLTNEIIAIKRQGYSLGIVIGGGNIFRGGKWKTKAWIESLWTTSACLPPSRMRSI